MYLCKQGLTPATPLSGRQTSEGLFVAIEILSRSLLVTQLVGRRCLGIPTGRVGKARKRSLKKRQT